MPSASGIVLLDKPEGVTSFQAISGVKRSLGSTRVGHTGTLDRFATGLLVLVCGRSTTLAGVFQGLEKCYEAVMRLGTRTDTLDPEGEIVETAPLPPLASLERSLPLFVGEIEQAPPAFSALHLRGQRAHVLARAGERVDLPARRVRVHSLEILGFDPPDLRIRVLCSRGTYVRALARDLAAGAGSCAHLRALRRTRVGPFDVREAVQPERFSPERDLLEPGRLIAERGLLPVVRVRAACVPALLAGTPLRDEMLEGAPPGCGPVACLDARDSLLAVAQRGARGYRYLAVFPEGAGAHGPSTAGEG